MAKVKSMPSNNSSSFFVNDASLPGLVSLEIAQEKSPKYDFGFSQLLNDKGTCSGQQYFDNDNWNGRKTDSKTSPLLSDDVRAPSSSVKKTVSSNFTSLGSLAENHLKKDRMLSELCFDGDFKLSDILSNDNCLVTNTKNTGSYENLNFCDLCLEAEDNLTNIELTSVIKSDVAVDDLSDLVDSSSVHILQCPTSLESLAIDHFLSNGSESKFENKFSDSFVFDLKNGDYDIQSSSWLDNILSQEKQECINNITETDTVDAFTEPSSSDSSETNDQKHESSDETSDGELFPDIDLSFCIKKNVKDKCLPYSLSPESEDSGFDETGSVPVKLSFPSEKSLSHKDILITHRDSCPFEKENLTSSKQSLFSRAISARPKICDARKVKLKQVRNELLKKSFSFNLMDCKQQKNSQLPERIIDHSNECVVVSSFLKVSNEK